MPTSRLIRFAAAALVAACAGTAHGAAPQVKTQAPGYHRVMLGDFEVTTLSDGTVRLPVDSDGKAAALQRSRAFAAAAREGHLVGVAHVSFPGLGRLRADGKGYVWVPLNYSGLK